MFELKNDNMAQGIQKESVQPRGEGNLCSVEQRELGERPAFMSSR